MACPQGVRTVRLEATIFPIFILYFLNTIFAMSVYFPIYSLRNFHIDLHGPPLCYTKFDFTSKTQNC